MGNKRVYGKMTGEQRQARRRAQLLDAGLDLLAEVGIAKVTVTAVCARAKLTPNYFYESFTNREALLEAIFEDVAAKGFGYAKTIVASAPNDLRSRVRAILEAGAAVVALDPRIMALGAGADKSELLMRLRTGMINTFAEQADWFLLTQSGDKQQARVAALFFAGGIAELVASFLNGKLELTMDEMLEHAVGLAAMFEQRSAADVADPTPSEST